MAETPDLFPLTPRQEIDLALSLPEGMELSPAAQALYAADGAARFAKFHPSLRPNKEHPHG